MDKVLKALRAGRDEHVDRLKEWLRIPSVSADSAHRADVRRAGEFILAELRGAGFQTKLVDTPGHPVVVAEWLGAKGAPTLLVYGHYDVQPPAPLELWRHGAFEPTVEGRNLIARGATDDKGQCLALVRGVAGMLAARRALPVNVKFLIEGEEEIGSPNLESFVRAHKDELAADVVLIADTAQLGPGKPALTVGLRGLLYMQIDLAGANRDLHSGSFGGAVANPANALCGMIAALKDGAGRVTIPGFYDSVRPLTQAERAQMAALPFDEREFQRGLGVEALPGEPGFTAFERKCARPTLDVNGLLAGWTGEGAKTVLPCKAMAKFSMRLVPDQDPETIRNATIAHLESLLPPGLKMKITCDHGAAPVLVPAEGPWTRAAVRAVAKGFGKEPVFMREGGSIPIVSTFRKVLGIDSILIGIGLPDDNAHAPNEKFDLDDFQRGIETAAHFLEEMATVSRAH